MILELRRISVKMSIKSIKRKIGIKLNKSFVRPIFDKGNVVFFHWGDRRRWLRKDKQVNEKYYVIRPQTNTQGLLSTYLYVLNHVKWCEENNYIPYVDFESKQCQYYTGRKINGSLNAWDYYFEQPSKMTKKDVYQKSNLMIGGWTFFKRNQVISIEKTPQMMGNEEIRKLARKYLPVRCNVIELAEERHKKLFHGKVLGVFLRGTDYVRLKPKGHSRQPSIEQAIDVIDQFVNKYDIDQIFVVTEDQEYFNTLKELYGDIVFSSDDSFIDSYNSEAYIESSFTNDAYERGLNYLIRILLIGKCDYFIGGITNGSLVSYCLKDGYYDDSYWFELGKY